MARPGGSREGASRDNTGRERRGTMFSNSQTEGQSAREGVLLLVHCRSLVRRSAFRLPGSGRRILKFCDLRLALQGSTIGLPKGSAGWPSTFSPLCFLQIGQDAHDRPPLPCFQKRRVRETAGLTSVADRHLNLPPELPRRTLGFELGEPLGAEARVDGVSHRGTVPSPTGARRSRLEGSQRNGPVLAQRLDSPSANHSAPFRRMLQPGASANQR